MRTCALGAMEQIHGLPCRHFFFPKEEGELF